MFDFDVQVEGALRAVVLGALGVGALELTFNIIGAAAIVLFATRTVPLTLQFVNIFDVEVLNRDDLLKDLVSVQ